MKPHAFHPEAAEEYTEAALRYARVQPELGGRFYDEIERLIRDIRREPERFRQFDPPARRHFSTLSNPIAFGFWRSCISSVSPVIGGIACLRPGFDVASHGGYRSRRRR